MAYSLAAEPKPIRRRSAYVLDSHWCGGGDGSGGGEWSLRGKVMRGRRVGGDGGRD